MVAMRYDNDVTNAARRTATNVIKVLRTSLAHPRRSAALGLAAAVGTGALMVAAGPHPATADAALQPQAAAVTTAVSARAGHATADRGLDRLAGANTTGQPATHPAAKPAAAQPATAQPATAQPAAGQPATGKNAKNAKAASAKAATARAAAKRTNAMLHTTPVAGLDQTQMRNAALIVKAGRDLGISERGQIVAVATAMQESNLYNRASHVVPESLTYDHQGTGSDFDSVGLFQQRYTTGWGTVKSIMNPEQSATKFYHALQHVHGWQNLPITVAAQTVQGSAFPDAYAKHQANATHVVHAINNTAAKH